jgi:multidrug efflux pump subunit AcrA (membrane-fusion protein)
MKRTKRRWPVVVIVLVVCAVAAVFVVPGLLPGGLRLNFGGPPEAASSAVAVEAAAGDIVSSVVATGNLAKSLTDVTMPYEVKIDDLLVAGDEEVARGDALATVDSTSLANRITDVKDELDDVNDAMADLVSGDTDTVYVRSKATARVKEIYIDEGKSVKDAKTSDGALMLLSLDGLMSVGVNSSTTLKRGDKVTVALPGGSEEDGTVESGGDGDYTITLPDDGPVPGESVSVKYKDEVIGEGTLEVHEPLRVTCGSGKITSVLVDENDKVYNGTSLLKVKKSSVNTSFASLTAKRDELVALLEKLSALAVDKTIYAPVSGVVNSIAAAEGSSVAPTEEDPYAEEGVILSIAEQKNMALSVDIDELDIAAIAPGLETDVEIDAIEGETFHGSVTETSDEADVETGVAKYSAVIEIERSDAMKEGMSATATITKEKREGVITIPLDAVQEFGDRIFVYMGIDGERGIPAKEKDIETGLSDGTNVEVVSGLSAGDIVYYLPVSTGDDGLQVGIPGMMRVGGSAGGAAPAPTGRNGDGPSFRVSGDGGGAPGGK